MPFSKFTFASVCPPQIVRYQADANGYVADVEYEGSANPSSAHGISSYKSGGQLGYTNPGNPFTSSSPVNGYSSGISAAKKYPLDNNDYYSNANKYRSDYHSGNLGYQNGYDNNYPRPSGYGKYTSGQQACTCTCP